MAKQRLRGAAARSAAEAEAHRRLQEAFAEGRLTLYLGAGVSVASYVPSWDRLVTMLYVNGIARRVRSPYVPGLIAGVGQWAFRRNVLPLEVAARKLRGFYQDDAEQLFMLRVQLYGLTPYFDRGRLRPAELSELLENNHTLRAVARLCSSSDPGRSGVRAVITYNYDDLLEKALGRFPCQSVSRATALKQGVLPIFHVHGFVPAAGKGGSALNEIVLSEDQYNRAIQNPYSWQNLVQIRGLAGSVALMVGLSLSDRNLRTILDALRNLPEPVEAYALLRYPEPWQVKDADVDGIVEEMKRRIAQGLEPGANEEAIAEVEQPRTRERIVTTIRAMEKQDLAREEATLNELGVRVLWYRDHQEIEGLLERVLPSPAAPSSAPMTDEGSSLPHA